MSQIKGVHLVLFQFNLQRTLVLKTFDRSLHIPSSVSLFQCHPLPSVPNFLHLCCSPHLCVSAIFRLFLFFLFLEACESSIMETPSFSAQAAKFILVVFRMFILFFLEGPHICGKTKRPGAGAFPLGIIEARVKIGKSFFREMELRICEHLPTAPPFSERWQRSPLIYFFVYLFFSFLRACENNNLSLDLDTLDKHHFHLSFAIFNITVISLSN